MSNSSTNEQEYQQDALKRLNNWLNVLEGRVCTLLSGNDPESMKPGEREQAVSRHLMLMLRLLQLRQKYAQANASASDQAWLDALLHDLSEDS